jgi:hypothetical protein
MIFIGLLVSMTPLVLTAQETQEDLIIKAEDAIHHDGEFVQVCGFIAETTYVRGDKGKPTYLNFHKPYPKQNFSVIVWREDRKNFDFAPESLEGYQACVYGQVVVRKSRAQMTIRLPDQIAYQKPKAATPGQKEAQDNK